MQSGPKIKWKTEVQLYLVSKILGTGGRWWWYGSGKRVRLYMYLLLHCHHQNDSCIKMGSDASHFNVTLILRDKVTRQCPQTTFEALYFSPSLLTRLGIHFDLGSLLSLDMMAETTVLYSNVIQDTAMTFVVSKLAREHCKDFFLFYPPPPPLFFFFFFLL